MNRDGDTGHGGGDAAGVATAAMAVPTGNGSGSLPRSLSATATNVLIGIAQGGLTYADTNRHPYASLAHRAEMATTTPLTCAPAAPS